MAVNNPVGTVEQLNDRKQIEFQWNAEAQRVIIVNGSGSLSGEVIRFVDKVDATTSYIGQATPGTLTSESLWQVKKITVAGAITSVLYADGNTLYDNEWDDRASLSYS